MNKFWTYITLFLLPISLSSCASLPLASRIGAPESQPKEKYKYYIQNFTLQKDVFLKPNGMYLYKNNNDQTISKEEDSIQYQAFLFCEKGTYFEFNHHLFSYSELDKIGNQKNTFCNYEIGDGFYKLSQNNVISFESYDRINSFTYRTGTVSRDSLFLDVKTDDWTKKKYKKAFAFIPFN